MDYNKRNQLLLLLICMTSQIYVTSQQTITIAWLCTEAPVFIGFSAGTNLGALSYALEEIQNSVNTSSDLYGYTFDVHFVDSDCNPKSSLGSLSQLLDDGVDPDLILGPLCSNAMLSAGLLGSDLNIPTFGWISSDSSVENKNQYTTLVRLLYPAASLGEGILLLMAEMGWKKAFMISAFGGDYGELGRGVREVIQDSASDGYGIVNWERDVDLTGAGRSKKINKIYRTVKQEARIVILSVPLSDLRDWMLGVFEQNMYKGDYVFIYINQQTPDQSLYNYLTSDDFWKADDGNNGKARKAYENLFMLFAKMNDFASVDQFLVDFNTSQYDTTYAEELNLTRSNPDFYSMFLYDSMKLYARVAQEVVDGGGTISDGAALFEKAKSSITTGGATGDIIMDDNADRVPDYWLFDLRGDGEFDKIAETSSSTSRRRRAASSGITRVWDFNSPPIWGDGSRGINNAPPDEPACGFDGSKCQDNTIYIIIGVVLGFLLIVTIVIIFVIRKILYEKNLSDMAWKINYDEVNLYTGVGGMPGSMMNLRSKSQLLSHRSESKTSVAYSMGEQLYITVGQYRGTTLAVKKVRKEKIDINRALLQEMRQVDVLNHNNLNVFVGACTDPPNICLCWEYAQKGSLNDVIWNEKIQLDDIFKFSIAADILKGLEYIHNSEVKIHGNLKSSNIVVDGRFQCKLTDLSFRYFTSGEQEDEDVSDYAKMKSLLWTSPEILRELYKDLDNIQITRNCGTQAGDVYSAAVIIKEVFARNDPFSEYDDLDIKEILQHILDESRSAAFRPNLDEIHSTVSTDDQDSSLVDKKVLDNLKAFICDCWAENEVDRPTVHNALKQLHRVNPFRSTSVIDNMVKMMEKYSAQLEDQVAERTTELAEEKKKTESLLSKMLPRSVAEDLKRGRHVEAESFESVTIYFSDIPGFTDFTSTCSPVQVVDLLNGVYSMMDDVISQHDVYKVETVGDVYVLAAGLPVRIGDRHIVEIVNCALDLVSGVLNLRIPSLPNYKVQLRMGIHTGPIVTGVIGLAMPRYCLFGDTINTSSRMESTGAPMRIHMSPFAMEALSKFGGYHLADRGKIPVKGKGEMNTYWLLGRNDFKKPLPNFAQLFTQDKQTAMTLPVTTGKHVRTALRPIRPSVESGYNDSMHGSLGNIERDLRSEATTLTTLDIKTPDSSPEMGRNGLTKVNVA